MGTRIMLFLCIIALSSCSIVKLDKFNYHNGPNAWINAYKDVAFYNCFMEGHQNDTILRNLIQKRDVQNPYEAIYNEDIKKAAQFGRKIAKGIPIATLGCEECHNGEKYITANCLHYYKSRELDSIARAEFKKFDRTHNRFWRKQN